MKVFSVTCDGSYLENSSRSLIERVEAYLKDNDHKSIVWLQSSSGPYNVTLTAVVE